MKERTQKMVKNSCTCKVRTNTDLSENILSRTRYHLRYGVIPSNWVPVIYLYEVHGQLTHATSYD